MDSRNELRKVVYSYHEKMELILQLLTEAEQDSIAALSSCREVS